MKHTLLLLLAISWAPVALAEAKPMSGADAQALIARIDERQSNSADFKAIAYVEQKERDKNDLVYEMALYRRDRDDKLIILFLKPRSEAGKGYLRIDRNLFLYDPAVGKWERRTERERIGGTDSRRTDFDESRLAEEYTATHLRSEALGRFNTRVLELSARPGAKVAYPLLRLWVDVNTEDVLKRQEFALSGKLMRTAYYPSWKKHRTPAGNEIRFPAEIRVYDEIEKGNQTIVLVRDIDLKPLDLNIFTKAWLERQSR